jgi:hypothetical protein
MFKVQCSRLPIFRLRVYRLRRDRQEARAKCHPREKDDCKGGS